MKMIEKTPESMTCIIGNCPAIFETDRDTFIVIGTQLSPELISENLNKRVNVGEVAVEFPKELIKDILSPKKTNRIL